MIKYSIAPISTELQRLMPRIERMMGRCPSCRGLPELVYVEDSEGGPTGLRWHHDCKFIPGWFGTIVEWMGLRKRMHRGMSFEAAVANINLNLEIWMESIKNKNNS